MQGDVHVIGGAVKWDAPLSAQSLCEALLYAFEHGKALRDGRIANGVTLNHSVDLEPTAIRLCAANEAVNGSLRMFRQVRNGKPRNWWSLGFIYE